MYTQVVGIDKRISRIALTIARYESGSAAIFCKCIYTQ